MNIKLILSSSLLGLSLTGCQTVSAPPLNTTTPTSNQPIKQDQFQISGKIGVRTPQQTGSAFYGWTQNGDSFAIDLTGALGIGQTSIRGTVGDVTLDSAKTGTIHATTPEELLLKATGWQAPITYLKSWVEAKPATAQAKTEQDDQGRLSQVTEGGWHASLEYSAQEMLPNRLIILDNAQQNRIILTIQSRD